MTVQPPLPSARWCSLKDEFHSLLAALEYIEQSPKYHPEGDALFHSLQVFQCALRDSQDPILWAAALFHDIGKAIDYPDHARCGARELEELLHPHCIWLIEHHLDLLIHPKRTRRALKNTQKLQDLEQLRRWDLQGRQVTAEVMSIHEALDILEPHESIILL